MTSINLSNCFETSNSFGSDIVPGSIFAIVLYLTWKRIHEYSTIDTRMNIRQLMIQSMMALGFPPDFGEFRETEFSVLVMQRKSVTSKPILPGIESFGTR